ncbi:aminopeptidase P family N-terminal domain-containing protein [Sinorhizobium sp. Sb3]|uniref:M24 family metallopeptidase n=1 Tax=Sinorhizobium sp. Sb3 TaxID=1358417 RepID=UPI0012E3C14E|nr:aminopeptidase P family N-terminal domain-containing protein [Sinorhizobium sp. Sb3]
MTENSANPKIGSSSDAGHANQTERAQTPVSDMSNLRGDAPHSSPHRADQINRVAALAEVLRARQIDAAIIDASEHLRYLFGYSPSASMYQCCIVTADGSVHGVVRKLDEALFSSVSWVEDRVTYLDWESPFDVLVAEIRRLGLASATIAQELDSYFLTVRDQRRIEAALPNARFADISGVILEMRARKSPAEIEEHRRAAAIADLGVAAIVDAIREGVSERDLLPQAIPQRLRLALTTTRPVSFCSAWASRRSICMEVSATGVSSRASPCTSNCCRSPMAIRRALCDPLCLVQRLRTSRPTLRSWWLSRIASLQQSGRALQRRRLTGSHEMGSPLPVSGQVFLTTPGTGLGLSRRRS